MLACLWRSSWEVGSLDRRSLDRRSLNIFMIVVGSTVVGPLSVVASTVARNINCRSQYTAARTAAARTAAARTTSSRTTSSGSIPPMHRSITANRSTVECSRSIYSRPSLSRWSFHCRSWLAPLSLSCALPLLQCSCRSR